MQRTAFFVVLLAALLFTSSMVILKNKKQPAVTGFAVVELFTSEGCSSCPPADEALAKLTDDYATNVYVLGFHVDYWNQLGWRDAYSDAAYSERQQHYASLFHLSSIYTPQAIVNGTTEFTGSDGEKLHSTVTQGLSETNPVSINVAAVDAGKNVTVSYSLPAAKGILNIALVQKHAQSNVRGGENGGKVLRHVNVVRDFKSIDIKASQGQITLAIPADLHAGDCSVIAYTQDANTWKVTGAAATGIK